MQQLVIFNYRLPGSDKIWQSERYVSSMTLSRSQMRQQIKDLGGRLLFAKSHTGTKYADGGRFV